FEIAGETATLAELDAMKNTLEGGLGEFVLDHMRDDFSGTAGIWLSTYAHYYNETPARLTPAGSGIAVWCMPALLDMDPAAVDSPDYTKLTAILEQIVHGRTGTANVWDEMSIWEIA